MAEVKFKPIDVKAEIEACKLEPYGRRLVVVEREVEQVGSIIVAETSKEMQTNTGYVVACGEDVDQWVQEGNLVYYGRYSGMWATIDGRKYRIMNDEDILGKIKDPDMEF